GGGPIWNATVTLGSRTTTTDGSGAYVFAGLSPGTYPAMTVSAPGYTQAGASGIVVAGSSATTRDFLLSAAVTSACQTDTTQADFQTGVPDGSDLATMPGSAILSQNVQFDQHADPNNPTLNGFGFNSTSFVGQTFTPGVTAKLAKVSALLFCAITCTGSAP